MDGRIASAIDEARSVRGANKAYGIDGSNRGAKDGIDVISKTIESGSQWKCDGSDQLDKPVTALNFRSSSVSTWTASSLAHSCSSCARIRASA